MHKQLKMGMAALSILLAAVLLLAGCQGKGSTNGTSAQKTVTIGYLPITHALPVFEEKELLEAQGSDVQIKLQKFSSWTDLMDALNAGKIDGASVLVELAMGAVGKGIDLKAVALGHRDGNVLVASGQINTPQDLKGKTIAIPSTQSSHNILVQDALTKAGLSTQDVTLTELSPAEMPSSL
ncbi:MAG: ABC transporter substrate-binding protein, partial [Eubacterium sp.]